ncbi:alpha/beta hydrolase [Mesorhizobium sp. LHD-90]|uniref:alpha/beta hydrolase n=1 Tax=Mesorhizobium sp. LHD-90 TaxID=3071414 RepID=UPI0027DFD7C1|nr:alpha/beta hydrolase [Mesorhizobium sp. LHD-90]MDQ6437966.1 alpha/beta hydrolase [Mesorhizobium sp. LHD-90]
MYFAQRALLFPGATAEKMPSAPPWGEWAAIRTPDGETLAALLSRPSSGKPTLLLFPGNGDNIVHYGFLADSLAGHGLGLLAVSYRGYPGSTGSPSETGLLVDGLAAFDWLEERGIGPVVLLGRSLGTGVAVNTAAERKAGALVLVSAYDSIASLAQRQYPLLPVRLLIRDSFRSDLRIAQVSGPKLFLHGETDGLIPLSSGETLFSLASEPKTFVVQHGHGHNDIWSAALVESIIVFTNALPSGASTD